MDLNAQDSLKTPRWRLVRIGALACVVIAIALLSSSRYSAGFDGDLGRLSLTAEASASLDR